MPTHKVQRRATRGKEIPTHKVFKVGEFVVHDGQGYTASIITNLAVTIIDGFTRGTTAWAMTFHVRNVTHGQAAALYVDFVNEEGGILPLPGEPKVVTTSWREQCYYGNQGYRRMDGIVNLPYDEFVQEAVSINLRYSPITGRIGPC